MTNMANAPCLQTLSSTATPEFGVSHSYSFRFTFAMFVSIYIYFYYLDTFIYRYEKYRNEYKYL